MDTKQTPRACSRFYCDKLRAPLCCADCERRENLKCKNACKNDPARCGLEAAAGVQPAKGRHGKKGAAKT